MIKRIVLLLTWMLLFTISSRSRGEEFMHELKLLLKDTTGHLTKNLSIREFQCRCKRLHCSRVLVYTKTSEDYQSIREEFGYPLRVLSGHRCVQHNHEVGGKELSYHMAGSAIDLQPIDGDLDHLEDTARKYFDVVIRYTTFIHCHNIIGG